MKLLACRRDADLAELRARSAALAYRQSADRLQSRLHRNWIWPLAGGLGSGMIAGLFPFTATLRAGNGLLRLAVSASQVPYGALAHLVRNARSANGNHSG